MSEKRILITSLLKPVNDTRMYGKLGLSLSKLPGVQVHIAAYDAPIPSSVPGNVTFHPIFRFSRLSIGRAVAQLNFYRLLLKVKPDVIIISTHELLLVSYTYKALNNCKIIYDIQENYSLNLRSQHNYHPVLKRLMAYGVESVEKLTAPSVTHYLVAEQSYTQELPFLKGNYTVLQNKYKPSQDYVPPTTPVRLPVTGPLRLLYSGTIAELYGVFEAVALSEQLHALHPEVSLTIIGYSAKRQTLSELKERIKDKPYITLIGGDKLVPHQQIVQQIQQSHLGLLPYVPNESTFRCMPTKLFEYMAHALPVLVQENPYWESTVKEHNAGLFINYLSVASKPLLQALRAGVYYPNGVPETLFWDEEERKLLQQVKAIL